MRLKTLIITISILSILCIAVSCILSPQIPGTYNTTIDLHISDTNGLDSEDALLLIIVDGLLEIQDVNTTFNKDRTGYATTQLLGAPDTIHFEWDYQHSDGVKLLFKDSTNLILNYNSNGGCWQAELNDDEAFTLFFMFTQL